MLPRKPFWFDTFTRKLGLALSAAGLNLSMIGLFLTWFSYRLQSYVTGLDFIVHGDILAILSYSLAWIVFLTYCLKPNRVGLWAIFFSIVFPCFFLMRWLVLAGVGHRGNPHNIFEPGGSPVNFLFTLEPGFFVSLVGMSLLVIGVVIGMNNHNRKLYMTTITPIVVIVGLYINILYWRALISSLGR